MEALEGLSSYRSYQMQGDLSRVLYEYDFPDWFVRHAQSLYRWDWQRILMDLKSWRFFFPGGPSGNNITGEYMSLETSPARGEALIERLAALIVELGVGEKVVRSLEADGFAVDKQTLSLVRMEGPISESEEEDRLIQLVRASGFPNANVIAKHIGDALALFVDGKDHASLGESRSLIQALVDDISTENDVHGSKTVVLPGGTGPRMEYLHKIGFFTADEENSFRSAWGALSAGSHPGVPARDEARIGLILALELSQLLLIKFTKWKANAFRRF